jgi:hypothetical protein
MNHYCGKCSCGEVAIQFSSPQEISSYKSRSCDCDYCVQREIEYLSGSQGQITFISKRPLCHEKQGSEQATFLLCLNCHNVVGVCYINKNICVGSLNSRLLEQYDHVQDTITVSPKKLSNVQKLGRWTDMWSQVKIDVV